MPATVPNAFHSASEMLALRSGTQNCAIWIRKAYTNHAKKSSARVDARRDMKATSRPDGKNKMMLPTTSGRPVHSELACAHKSRHASAKTTFSVKSKGYSEPYAI